MGLIKKSVGRASNKAMLVRRILKLIVMIIVVVLAVLIGYYLGVNEDKKISNKNDSNINEKEIDKNSVSEETTKKLLKLVGINELSGEIDYSDPNSIIYRLSEENGIISNLSNSLKADLIFKYAYSNNLLGKVDGNENNICSGGSGSCPSLTTNEAYNIASKYNINNLEFFEKFDDKDSKGWVSNIYTYNDKYLFIITGGVIFANSKYKVTSSYIEDSDDIILTVKLTVNNIVEEKIAKENNISLGNNRIVKLTYKLDSNNNYYLYSSYTE